MNNNNIQFDELFLKVKDQYLPEIYKSIKNNPKAKEAYNEIINFNNELALMIRGISKNYELDKLLNKTFPAILFMVVYPARAHIMEHLYHLLFLYAFKQ